VDDSTDDTDRRGEDRAPIELKVEYRRLNAFFADYTKNISRGGTFIATGRPLPIGTAFVFRLFVPTLDQPISLRGRVKWIIEEPDPAGREPGMGIRFIFTDDAERAVVERMVEKLMVDSLGPLVYAKLTAGRPRPDDDDDEV
jgi:type IV pilus assembly protein PilZ